MPCVRWGTGSDTLARSVPYGATIPRRAISYCRTMRRPALVVNAYASPCTPSMEWGLPAKFLRRARTVRLLSSIGPQIPRSLFP